jgi:hypothetical protein
MENKKTALQQLVDIVEQRKNATPFKSDVKTAIDTVLNVVKSDAEKLLQTEREQLEEAYVSGRKDGWLIRHDDDDDPPKYSTSYEWFNETYETK